MNSKRGTSRFVSAGGPFPMASGSVKPPRILSFFLSLFFQIQLLVGCGGLIATTGFEEPSLSFSGIRSLKERPDGSWLLEWEPIQVVNLTYEVFTRQGGSEPTSSAVGANASAESSYNFASPIGKTSDSFFVSDNLLLKSNTCFVVRAKHSELVDTNFKELCTGHSSRAANISNVSPPIFNSLTLINGAADGKLNALEMSADQPTVALDALSFMYARFAVAAQSVNCSAIESYGVGIPRASDFGGIDGTRSKVCVKLFNLTGAPVYGESEVVTVATLLPVLSSVQLSNVVVNSSMKTSPLSLTLNGSSGSSYKVSCLLNCTIVSGGEGVLSSSIPGVATAQILVSGEGVFRVAGKLIDKAGNESSETIATGQADFVAPTISIGQPNFSVIPVNGSVSFPLTISGAVLTELVPASVNLSGSSSCAIAVTNGTSANPIVNLLNCSSAGSVSISIASGIASDESGNSSISTPASAVVSVSNATPTVNNFALVNGASDGILNASDVASNQPVVSLDASGFESVAYSVIDSAGSCGAYNVYSPSVPLAANISTTDGSSKVVCVKLVNSLGTSTYAASPSIVVDKTAPVVSPPTIINVGVGNKLNATQAAANLPILNFTYAAGESAGFAIADSSVQCSSALSYSPAVPTTGHPGFVNGTNKVVCVKLSDAAGNSAYSFSSAISTDTQVPLAPVVSAAVLSDTLVNIAENPAGGFAVVIQGEAGASFTLTCATNCSVVSGGTVAGGAASTTGSLTATSSATVNVKATASGSFAFNAVLTDSYGNASTATNTTGTAVLTAPTVPTLSMAALTNGISISENASPMNVSVSSGASASGLSYTFSCTTNCEVKSGATGFLNASGQATPTIQVYTDGSFSLSATVTDAAGNTSTGTLSGTADLTAPVVSIGPPTATAITASGSVSFPVTITGSSSVNLLQSNVTPTYTGGVSCTIAVTNGTTASPTVTLSACSGSGSLNIALAAGIAQDAAGNSSALVGPSATVTVNNSAPVLTALTLINGASDGKLNSAEATADLPVVTLDATGFDTAAYAVVASTATCDVSQTYTAGIPRSAAASFTDGATVKVCVKLLNSLGVPTFGGSGSILVDKTAPTAATVTLINAATDNKINLAEATANQSVVSVTPGSEETAAYAIAGASSDCTSSLSYSASVPTAGHAGFVSGTNKVVCVKLSDAAGNSAYSFSSAISTDTQVPLAPVVSAAVLSDTLVNIAENPAGGFAVVIQGEAGASFTLTCATNCSVVSGGTVAGGGASTTGSLNATGSASVNVKATNSGAFAFNTVQTDSYGNASTATNTTGTAVLSAPTAPTLSMTALADTFISISENASPVNVSVSSGASASGLSYTFSCTSNCEVKSGATGTLNASGTATPTVQVYTGGTFAMSATVTDAAGNISSGTLSGTADLTAPVVSIGSPTATAITASGSVSFPITITGSSTVNLLQTNVNTTYTGGVSCTVAVTNGTTASPTVTLSSCSNSGTVLISIAAGIAADTAGNQSGTSSASATFAVVASPPTLSFTSPLNNALKNAASFNLEGTCTAGLTVVISSTDLSQPSVTGICSGAGIFQIPIQLAGSDGSKTFLATSVDATGQVSSASRTFIKDTVAPLVVVSAPSASGANASSTISYTVSYSDSNGIAVVSLSDVAVQSTGTASCTKSIVANSTLPSTVNITNCTGDGTFSFTVPALVASDPAGNFSLASTTSAIITVDNSAPALSITSPANGSSFGNQNVSTALTGTCESGLSVVLMGDVNSGQTTTCSGGSFSFASFALNSGFGSKSVYVRQTDAVGNVGNSGSRTFTLQAADGASSSNPAYSCKQIKSATPTAASGLYWINVNGTAQQLYCDNSTDGGGWTRWVKQTNSRSGFRVDIDSGTAGSNDFVLSTFRIARSSASQGGDSEYLFKMDGETYTLKASSMFLSSSQANINLTLLNGAATIANYLPSGSWPSVVHEENSSPVCRQWGRYRYPSNSYPTYQFQLGSYTYRTAGSGSWCSDWCGQSGAMTYSFQILPYMYKNEYCYSGSSAGNYEFIGNTIDIYLREKGSGSDPLAANLILAMPFSTSSTEDISGAGMTISANGSFTISNVRSKFYSGSGLAGNSSSDSIRVSGSNGLHWYLQTQWTAEGWVWATPGSGFQFIASADGGGLYWWGIQAASDGSLGWYGWTSGPSISAPAGTVPFGQWVHWASSRNGNALATWINGTRVAYNSSASWNIGSNMGYINFSGTGNASYPLYRQDHRVYTALKYDPSSPTISLPAAIK